MPFYIGHKLDFLMTLTGTRNNVLARALNFDSSHISRMRSCERGLPRHRSFIEPASEYFARNIRTPYQIRSAEETICPGKLWPEREQERAALIAAWLAEDGLEPIADREMWKNGDDAAVKVKTGKAFYFGNAGKREAVERFLETLQRSPMPVTMLLYSDENMEWMYEDIAFARRWFLLMAGLLKKGARIRIVHNLGRNLSEMLEALKKWMPLYMVGSIEPYFCTRTRDHVFCQTRFIAKDTAAVIASSV